MTENQRQILDADVRDISYLDEGTGPAIVLLPEAGLDFAYFGALASILVEEDFRVVRIATRRSGARTLHDLAEDVVDVLGHLGISEAWIGGHGFGGAVARTVAIDHHERVNGVLLLGVTREAPDGDDFDAEVRAVFGDAFSPQADVRRVHADALAATDAEAWQSVADATPVLVVQGAADRVTPVEAGEALRETAPGLVSVKVVDGAGHFFPLTHPGETSWFIEDYLDWD
ncbi:alpha/beta fold hydrolase [Microbacterium hominis]|uniref:Alpha/beta hydrolase n=1 Tax=Microbacterium hominis TaxID=162426 RepID=A0A0B4D0H6_9MICO|nr:alpha/beta hydrolase [Microbacterium hominis]KIC57770.1 alpha/beta hydrolase [Microbacterium hominis]